MNSSRDHPNQTVFQSTQSLEFPVPLFPTAWIDIKQTFHWVLHQSHKHALPYTFPEKENSTVDYFYVLFIALTWSVAFSSAVTHGSVLGSLLFVVVKRLKKNWLLPRVKLSLKYLEGPDHRISKAYTFQVCMGNNELIERRSRYVTLPWL